MKQTQLVRRHRRAGGGDDTPVDLPTKAASDTTNAAKVIAKIDAVTSR